MLRLVLPLPFPGLNHVNAYLLTDADGATLVDPGISDPYESEDYGWKQLIAALRASGSDVHDIKRLVVTHAHVDHYGLAARLLEETGCELWMHVASKHELELYDEGAAAAIANVRALLTDHGVGPDELDELTALEDWSAFVSGVVEPTVPVHGGESFTVADRLWDIVYTPGHARSHICLWASEGRLLISGDHLLPTITPHIDLERGGEEDPLGKYLESLVKVEKLDPALVLPGHGRPFEEGAERARVTARHHDRRLGAILQVIRQEACSASEITEEIFSGALLNFQRRLALGEVLAHLAYLIRRGEIERMQRDDGTFAYRKISKRSERGEE